MTLSMVNPNVADGDLITSAGWLAEFQNILEHPMDLFDPLLLNDKGSDPATVGEIARSASVLKYFDGQVRNFAFSDQLTTLNTTQNLQNYIARSVGELNVSNTAAISALFNNIVLPANTMNDTAALQVEALIYFNSLLNSGVCTIRPVFGTSLLGTYNLNNTTGSDQLNFGVNIHMVIASRNANSQATGITLAVDFGVAARCWGAVSGSWWISSTVLTVENATTALPFHIDCQFDSASVGNSANGIVTIIKRLAL